MNGINLKQFRAYELTIGDVRFGDFFERSQWEGFTRMTNDHGDLEIIIKTPTHLDENFGLWSAGGGAQIVSASVQIIKAINDLQHQKSEQE